jgi:hypothetical protein
VAVIRVTDHPQLHFTFAWAVQPRPGRSDSRNTKRPFLCCLLLTTPTTASCQFRTLDRSFAAQGLHRKALATQQDAAIHETCEVGHPHYSHIHPTQANELFRRHHYDLTKTFELLVGKAPNQQRFTVYHDLLVQRSEFFRAARSSRWTKEGKPTTLDDYNPEVFSTYLYCLYFGASAVKDRLNSIVEDNPRPKSSDSTSSERSNTTAVDETVPSDNGKKITENIFDKGLCKDDDKKGESQERGKQTVVGGIDAILNMKGAQTPMRLPPSFLSAMSVVRQENRSSGVRSRSPARSKTCASSNAPKPAVAKASVTLNSQPSKTAPGL